MDILIFLELSVGCVVLKQLMPLYLGWKQAPSSVMLWGKHRLCYVLSHLFYLPAAMFLSSLHQIPEEELAQCSTILPPHTSSFAQLFTSDKCMQVNLSPQSRSRAGGDSLKAGPGRSSRLIKGFSQPSLNTCSSRVLHWFPLPNSLGESLGMRCIA